MKQMIADDILDSNLRERDEIFFISTFFSLIVHYKIKHFQYGNFFHFILSYYLN